MIKVPVKPPSATPKEAQEPLAQPPPPPIEYRVVLDSQEIESALLVHNTKHYGQAKETPFGHAPLYNLLGTDGTSDFCKQVLDGNYDSAIDLDSTSQELRLMLDQLKRKELPPISANIQYSDFVQGLRSWPEKTSILPSGRHLGHYKSLLVKSDDAKSTKLLKTHHQMTLLVVLRARPYERWCRDLEVMLEKEPGNPLLHRLRIICLYEADYNLYLKQMWAKRAVRHAEDHNCLGNEQGGSRPNRFAINVANMKALTYTFARLSKTGLGTFNNDAKSCFDSIMAALALIYCIALGMPDAPCQIHGQAISKMKHYVKTLQGTSQNYYSNALNGPLFGSGQGSGGSPSLWLFMWVALAAAL